MAGLRDSWRTSLLAAQQPWNPQPESIARTPYDTPLAIAQRTGEQHRPEWFAVLPILEDLGRIVAPLVDGGLVLPNCISVGLLAVHEMRVLPKQLVLGVAGQLNEGPICED